MKAPKIYKKDIFNSRNITKAIPYIGSMGYFCYEYSKDLNDWSRGKLVAIHPGYGDNIRYEAECETKDEGTTTYHYGLFVPEDRIKS